LEKPVGGEVLGDTIEVDNIPADVGDAVDGSDVGLSLWDNESGVKISRTTHVCVAETVLPWTDTDWVSPKVGSTEKV
jgi:hypothetical protein